MTVTGQGKKGERAESETERVKSDRFPLMSKSDGFKKKKEWKHAHQIEQRDRVRFFREREKTRDVHAETSIGQQMQGAVDDKKNPDKCLGHENPPESPVPFENGRRYDTLFKNMKAGDTMAIVELNRDDYAGYRMEDSTDVRGHYRVKVKNRDGVTFSIKEKSFWRKRPVIHDVTLFAPHVEHGHVYGIFEKKTLVAVIEGAVESWNNRYRIWNLMVLKAYRRRGYGKALITHVTKIARKAKCRAMVLEVRSINQPAIRFYLGEGFGFIGLDTMAYSNKDIRKKDVRLEMGKEL
jgi:ribosomal protein S18 acetylase RimI-like enzyme